MTEQEMIDKMNKTLDRIEVRMDNMNKILDEIIGEIDKHKNEPSKNITTTYDGGIIFRNKRNKNNDSDESMYDINRSI